MSQRYHRGGTYETRNPLAATSPLRSAVMNKPGWAVFGPSWHDGTWNQPKVVPVAAAAITAPPVDPERVLANAEARLREAIQVYDSARRDIGDANRTMTQAITYNGRIVMPTQPFTPERIKARKSAAFKLFNRRRSELVAARRRVAAARAALGLPVEPPPARVHASSQRFIAQPVGQPHTV